MGLLSDRKVLITGASRGIGEAIAVAYAKEGATLYLVARTESHLQEVSERCKEQGALGVHTFALDMMDPKAISHLAEELGPRIDTLVNNAGIVDSEPVFDASHEKYEAMIRLNLITPMRMTKDFGPYLEKNPKGGIIINISSCAGRDAVAHQAGYAASKWGLTGWTRSTFEALRPKNIRVMGIFPQYTVSDMTIDAPLPQAQMIRAEDIAEAALLLFRMSPLACPTEIVVRNSVAYK